MATRRSTPRSSTCLRSFYEALGLSGLHRCSSTASATPNCRPAYIEKLRAYYADKLDRLCADCRAPLRHEPAAPARLQERALPALQGRRAQDRRQPLRRLRRALRDRARAARRPRHRLRPRPAPRARPRLLHAHRLRVRARGGRRRRARIGGGGRYDGLIEQLGGQPTPGIGFGTGIERIILNLKRQELAPPPDRASTPSSPSPTPAAQGRACPARRATSARAGLRVVVGSRRPQPAAPRCARPTTSAPATPSSSAPKS